MFLFFLMQQYVQLLVQYFVIDYCCVWQVYLSLVKMYLHPPELNDLGIKSDRVQIERNDEKAMIILQQYHSKIDTAQVTHSLTIMVYQMLKTM